MADYGYTAQKLEEKEALVEASGGAHKLSIKILQEVSVQTTEKYLGCKQRLRGAVNDQIGIEPNS